MNKRKKSFSTKNGSYHLNRGIFQIGNRKLKKIAKIIERIIRDSKVSMKKNSKKFKRVENFVKKFESFCFQLSTVIERSI